jgi:hypothetical protein
MILTSRLVARVEVDDFGVTVRRSLLSTTVVSWSDIRQVVEHRTYGSLALVRQVHVGFRTRWTLTFALSDPRWKRRATTQAILSRLDHINESKAAAIARHI